MDVIIHFLSYVNPGKMTMTRNSNSTNRDVEAPLWLTIATAVPRLSEAVVDDDGGAL